MRRADLCSEIWKGYMRAEMDPGGLCRRQSETGYGVSLGLLAGVLAWATVARMFSGLEQLGAAVVIVPVTLAVVGCIVFRESREKRSTRLLARWAPRRLVRKLHDGLLGIRDAAR